MESNTSKSTSEGNLPLQGVIFSISSLYAYLLRIHDRRKRRGIRYALETILVVLILAKLCGLDKPYEIADWAQNRSEFLVEVLHLKRARLPHHSTYRRILESVLDQDEFERTMRDFIQQCPGVGQEVVIAIDGKTLRGTITRDDPFGLHLLAAHLPGEGIVLFQMVVEQEKENEIVVAPQLLKSLDLRQKVVVPNAVCRSKLPKQVGISSGSSKITNSPPVRPSSFYLPHKRPWQVRDARRWISKRHAPSIKAMAAWKNGSSP